MTFNLRLPADLDVKARAHSQSLGISLNALICVALGQYLKNDLEAPPAASIPLPVLKPFVSMPLPVLKLSKAQRREITAQARLARKS